jgi:hypothetical protein
MINTSNACGFFSDVLHIMVAISYYDANNIDWCIYWNSKMYQDDNDSSNLFDRYFFQKNDYKSFIPDEIVTNDIIEYNRPVKHPSYQYMIQYSDCLINNDLLNTDFFKKLDTFFDKDKKILGIHRRVTDKLYEYPSHITNMENYEGVIMDYYNSGDYDNIFMITDDINSEKYFKQKYGELFITTNSIKGDNNSAVHVRMNYQNKLQLGDDVLRDSYLLSKTNFKILTDSNVAAFALACNLKPNSWIFID